jgi:CheY-like chemotaxis protein
MEPEAQRSEGSEPVRPQLAAGVTRYPWPNLSGIHVFLVEDNCDTRLMVGDTLRYCGAIVTAYESAEKAMANLTEVVPSIFICDLSMPGIDGLEFMLRLRMLPPELGGRMPSIAITAYYEDFAAAAALEVGFDAYMTKPIKLEHLCRLVKEMAAPRSRCQPDEH